MTDPWQEFFMKRTVRGESGKMSLRYGDFKYHQDCTVEELYQAFKARLLAETQPQQGGES